MKLSWNNKTAFVTYLAVGIIGAAIFRMSCSPGNNALPIGKTIHLMPINLPPQNK